jgi:hypothetical protein
MVDEAQVKSEFNKQSGAHEEDDAATSAAAWEPRKFEDGDVTREFNAEVTKEAATGDADDSGSTDTHGSSDSAAAGSAEAASSSATWEPPDYAKDTYRTEDDDSNDAAHRGGHGFTPGP